MFMKYHWEVYSKGLLRQKWIGKTFKDINRFILLQLYKKSLVTENLAIQFQHVQWSHI